LISRHYNKWMLLRDINQHPRPAPMHLSSRLILRSTDTLTSKHRYSVLKTLTNTAGKTARRGNVSQLKSTAVRRGDEVVSAQA